MSREIKFKVWDKINNIMCDWNDIIREGNNRGSTHLLHDVFTKDHFVILQYTGLKDCNGKEIYEGDILFYAATNHSSMEVKFKDGCFVGEGPFNTLPLIDYINAIDFDHIEVIGNIYESPELLNPS